MKFLLSILIAVPSLVACAQNNEICIITSIKGDVRRSNQKPVRVQDTISLNSIMDLKYYGHVPGLIYFYDNQKKSSARYHVKSALSISQDPSYFEFVNDILTAKAKTFPYGSRGACTCVIIEECLSTDPEINQKILIFDTLSFPVESNIQNADSFFYFLQWKNDGKIFNNRLHEFQGDIILTSGDLAFNGKYYNESGDELLTLGFCKILNGEKKFRVISKVNISLVSSDFLKEYYEALQKGMEGVSSNEIYDAYYKDIYVFFGKPNQCRLKKLINYSN